MRNDSKEVVRQLKRKLSAVTSRQLAQKLGMTPQSLSAWSKGTLTSLKVANLVKKGIDVAVSEFSKSAIRPLVEFYELRTVDSRGGKKSEIFSKENSLYTKDLRGLLEQSFGIYIFYDSRGRALYAGKAIKRPLWNEIKNAFNRSRATQTVFRVSHPNRNQHFRAEKHRQPRREPLLLADLAAYISVYTVDRLLTGLIEALIIRSFANDLLNKRMETFGTRKRRPKK